MKGAHHMSNSLSMLNSLKATSLLEGSHLLVQVRTLAESLTFKNQDGQHTFDDYFIKLQNQTGKIPTLALMPTVPTNQGQDYKIELANGLESIEDQIERLMNNTIVFRGRLQNAQSEVADLAASFEAWYTVAAVEFLKESKISLPMASIKAIAISEFNELMGRANVDVDVVLEAVKVLEKQLASKKKRAREKYETGLDQANAVWLKNLPANNNVPGAPRPGMLLAELPVFDDEEDAEDAEETSEEEEQYQEDADIAATLAMKTEPEVAPIILAPEPEAARVVAAPESAPVAEEPAEALSEEDEIPAETYSVEYTEEHVAGGEATTPEYSDEDADFRARMELEAIASEGEVSYVEAPTEVVEAEVLAEVIVEEAIEAVAAVEVAAAVDAVTKPATTPSLDEARAAFRAARQGGTKCGPAIESTVVGVVTSAQIGEVTLKSLASQVFVDDELDALAVSSTEAKPSTPAATVVAAPPSSRRRLVFDLGDDEIL
jgi:hypothetical protein